MTDAKTNGIILVPTDFSEVCYNAATQAAEAAKLLNQKVVLLHIINSDTEAYLRNENLTKNSIDEKLQEIASQLKLKYGVDIDYLTRKGSIFTSIGDVAKELGISMIYLGTHGKVGLQHLTGSYALKVVTSSVTPTIIVGNKPFADGYKKIILPITSDAGPMEKTRWAVYIAKRFNATIHIYLHGDAGNTVFNASKQIAEYFSKNDVKYSERTSEKGKNFADQVIDYATRFDADLIMIMTNPGKGLGKFLLGSYDEDIIFNANQIPVMCINPRKLNFELAGF